MLENEQEYKNRLLPFFKLWRAHPQNAPESEQVAGGRKVRLLT